MFLKIILLMIFTEGIVELIFKSSPLYKLRYIIMDMTPFLHSDEFDYHLLECKYCTSFWISCLSAFFYFHLQNKIIFYFILIIVIQRLSNYIHLLFSIIRDFQLNIRIKRGT